MPTTRGKLFVLSGPSGSGKNALLDEISLKLPNLVRSISVTTRPPRGNEQDGKDYFFVADEAFRGMVERSELLEWASIFGHEYGTPAAWAEEQLQAGRDVLLEIDVQGALQVKEKRTDAILIFVTVPSMDELRRRLEKRGTESREQIAARMAIARREMALADRYDYQIVNDDFQRASAELTSLIEGQG